ncbi:hypothetical protein QR680_000647 [Steinernema hermaphroditum]|uniref:Uncharacterized protein n=1 Tax=Steinernema hermaphroditum TaxID=289476 RepID=A0AA39GW25_9BILA|nr:hypothetical protein QR680_000647 [Steinernema hermaphroditum]
MTRCAVAKCLPRDVLQKGESMGLKMGDMFAHLVESFDLVCVATKCTEECKLCDQCEYALQQMAALINGEETGGLCPKLETCSANCIKEDLDRVLQCIGKKCNIHCYDGDCPSCVGVARRMFMQVCREQNMPSMASIQFDGNCTQLFREMSNSYVMSRTN